MGEMKGIYRILVGKTEGETLLPDPGVDVRIILK
jgi:hypothetical protein